MLIYIYIFVKNPCFEKKNAYQLTLSNFIKNCLKIATNYTFSFNTKYCLSATLTHPPLGIQIKIPTGGHNFLFFKLDFVVE